MNVKNYGDGNGYADFQDKNCDDFAAHDDDHDNDDNDDNDDDDDDDDE